jgi:hypothetical protein
LLHGARIFQKQVNHETHERHENRAAVSFGWNNGLRRSKAVLKQPQSRRSAILERLRIARSVWTACGSPPLSRANSCLSNQTASENRKGRETIVPPGKGN